MRVRDREKEWEKESECLCAVLWVSYHSLPMMNNWGALCRDVCRLSTARILKAKPPNTDTMAVRQVNIWQIKLNYHQQTFSLYISRDKSPKRQERNILKVFTVAYRTTGKLPLNDFLTISIQLSDEKTTVQIKGYPSREGQTGTSATRWRAGAPGMLPILECSSHACASDLWPLSVPLYWPQSHTVDSKSSLWAVWQLTGWTTFNSVIYEWEYTGSERIVWRLSQQITHSIY